MKAIEIIPHLTLDELRKRFKTAATHDERTRWQALMLLSDPAHPRSRGEVAQLVQRSANWISTTVTRYNTEGPEGPRDRRKGRSHPPFLLKQVQRLALDLRLQTPPEDEGKWTARQVAAWIEETVGHPVNVVTGWNDLRRLQYTVQLPRPQHPQAASLAEQDAFKKKFRRSSKT